MKRCLFIICPKSDQPRGLASHDDWVLAKVSLCVFRSLACVMSLVVLLLGSHEAIAIWWCSFSLIVCRAILVLSSHKSKWLSLLCKICNEKATFCSCILSLRLYWACKRASVWVNCTATREASKRIQRHVVAHAASMTLLSKYESASSLIAMDTHIKTAQRLRLIFMRGRAWTLSKCTLAKGCWPAFTYEESEHTTPTKPMIRVPYFLYSA